MKLIYIFPHPDDESFSAAGSIPTFLMAIGYEQVRSITAAIGGGIDAARKVELDLPNTGLFNSGTVGIACCGVGAT